MKLFLLGLVFSLSFYCSAEVLLYKTTDNTGINKLERIGVIEQYLVTLSEALQNMETKLEATVLKVASLEKVVSEIKEVDIKTIEKKLGEKALPVKTPEMEELNKLQADLRVLKNEDIEIIRIQIQGLNSSVSQLQSKVK